MLDKQFLFLQCFSQQLVCEIMIRIISLLYWSIADTTLISTNHIMLIKNYENSFEILFCTFRLIIFK